MRSNNKMKYLVKAEHAGCQDSAEEKKPSARVEKRPGGEYSFRNPLPARANSERTDWESN